MIVGTSALIAVLLDEEGSDPILGVLDEEPGFLPLLALAEFWAGASGSRVIAAQQGQELVDEWRDGGLTALPFTEDHAHCAFETIPLMGETMGREVCSTCSI